MQQLLHEELVLRLWSSKYPTIFASLDYVGWRVRCIKVHFLKIVLIKLVAVVLAATIEDRSTWNLPFDGDGLAGCSHCNDTLRRTVGILCEM